MNRRRLLLLGAAGITAIACKAGPEAGNEVPVAGPDGGKVIPFPERPAQPQTGVTPVPPIIPQDDVEDDGFRELFFLVTARDMRKVFPTANIRIRIGARLLEPMTNGGRMSFTHEDVGQKGQMVSMRIVRQSNFRAMLRGQILYKTRAGSTHRIGPRESENPDDIIEVKGRLL